MLKIISSITNILKKLCADFTFSGNVFTSSESSNSILIRVFMTFRTFCLKYKHPFNIFTQRNYFHMVWVKTRFVFTKMVNSHASSYLPSYVCVRKSMSPVFSRLFSFVRKINLRISNFLVYIVRPIPTTLILKIVFNKLPEFRIFGESHINTLYMYLSVKQIKIN